MTGQAHLGGFASQGDIDEPDPSKGLPRFADPAVTAEDGRIAPRVAARSLPSQVSSRAASVSSVRTALAW